MKLINKNNKLIHGFILLGALLCISILALLYLNRDKSIDEQMSITTNSGNIIDTEYKDLGRFSIKIPKDFELMSEDLLKIKYPFGNQPKATYSNEDASISIVYNTDATSLKDMTVSDYVNAVKSSFSKMGYFYYYYPIEKNDFIIHTISLTTKAVDTNIYNRMAFFDIDNELIIISFNCIEEYQSEWDDVADFILHSIKK